MVRLVAAALVALVVLAPARAAHVQQCGLPDQAPLWIDYAQGTVSFRQQLFARPGIIAATSGTGVAQALRSGGAQTIYWENKLGSLVGTTAKPADPASIDGAAAKLVSTASASSACATPLIGLNELQGASATTPWTATNAQYRANVLALLGGLSARGARPFLLISSQPYTRGEAGEWWRQAGQVSDLVPEVYFNASSVMKLGVVLGSRRVRTVMRAAIAAYTDLGISPSRLGMVLGFQTSPGGRAGLQPSAAWFRYVKLYTLAARQVATELGVGTVWSWGWGTFSAGGADPDPDKPAAACVYLWARDQSLCDGPGTAGPGFDTSLDEGQILLAEGVQCALGSRSFSTAAVGELAQVTGDAGVALSILYARMVEGGRTPVPADRVLDFERRLVSLRFGGSRTAYLAALRSRGATVAVARGAIEDALRRAAVSPTLAVARPTSSQVASFYASFPGVGARLVTASPAPSWLGGRRRGFALEVWAPSEVFGLALDSPAQVLTTEGEISVTPLENRLPLSAVPFELARPAIKAALTGFARSDALDIWATTLEERALDRVTCRRDELPSVDSISLSSYLLFLAFDP